MSDSETDIQYKVTGEFKKNVIRWVEIDDTIRELRVKTKEMTQEKKNYEEFILNFLETVDEKSVGIVDGKLTRSVSQCKAPLKKENIHKALVEITGDNNKALQMTEHIIKSRGTTERVNLKRTKNRKQKD
tara:strand:+ start:1489 stop:1878 length:390 start_codon:yes stop_codon:yes gene_type:complete